MKLSIVLLAVMLSPLMCAQDGMVPLESGFRDLQKSNTSTEEAIKAYEVFVSEHAHRQSLWIGEAYHELGKLYHKNKEYDKAITATHEAVRRKIQAAAPLESINKSRYNLTILYDRAHMPEKAIALQKEIILQEHPDRYFFRACNKLYAISEQHHDYYTALDFLKKAIESDIFRHGRSSDIGQTLTNYLSVSSKFETLDEKEIGTCKQYADTLYQVLEKPLVQRDLRNLVASHLNMAIILERNRKYGLSERYYDKAEVFYHSLPEKDSLLYYRITLNRAILHSVQGKTASAQEQYGLALNHADGHPEKEAYVFDNQSFYLPKGKEGEKLQLYHKALCLLLDEEEKMTDLTYVPSAETIKETVDKNVLLVILNDKAENLLQRYREEKEESYLVQALKNISLADELITYIRLNSAVDRSKLLWVHRGTNLYALGIEASYHAQDLEQMHYFMEKNKALVLLERLVASKQKNQWNPEATYHSISDEAYMAYSEKLTIDSLPRVQHTLDDETAIMEYAKGREHYFGLYITAHEMQAFAISNEGAAFEKNLLYFNKMASKPFESTKDQQAFYSLGHKIYQQLFPLEKSPKQRLMLIPDGVLRTLSFDALVIENTGKPVYCIEQHELFYEYSLSLYQTLALNNQTTTSPTFLALAPKTYAGERHMPLIRSTPTIREINGLFSADVSHLEATREDFVGKIGNYDIVHLNTHAGYDDTSRETWIAFQDQDLLLTELYELRSEAALISVAACETAIGEHIEGEGMMSLSRAFFYMGAQSVVSTLWKANEKTTNQIFLEFYKNLAHGDAKPQALKKAKITYLETHQLSELSPYYWAGIVFIGNPESISTSKPDSSLYLVLLLAIGMAFTIWWLKKRGTSL